jgi:ABC transport system ATP-binding/permease protein
MLSLNDISVNGLRDRQPTPILKNISVHYPLSHFGAIIGPSGCGKSTFLKTVAGIMPQSQGKIHWMNNELGAAQELNPGDLGYVPQFSVLHDELTVEESIRFALLLRVSGLGTPLLETRIQGLLEATGLSSVAKAKTAVLSGGQKRRLGLALELVSTPRLLLCDEVTSGLDLKSEDEIVELLKNVSGENSRLVLCVTHSLRHLHLYDSVTLLYQGHLIFHGLPGVFLDYFRAESTDQVFTKLTTHGSEEWGEFWLSARAEIEKNAPVIGDDRAHEQDTPRVPGFFTQFVVLLGRKTTLFFRDKSQLWLQLALMLVFPALVALFAYRGLPQIKNMTLNIDTGILKELTEALEFNAQLGKIGGLVSGLAMFQVILLALLASNNASREVVAGRPQLEKEKLGGLNVASYLGSNMIFFFVLVLIQSAWMTLFVKEICGLPGGFYHQFGFLFMVNAAMTATSLAMSSWSRSNEQASLLCVYLVGFQLPLSGAVLALPEAFGQTIRPLIAAYWSWSGYLQTFRDTRFYDLVVAVSNTPFSSMELSYWVLSSHVVLSLLLAYVGCSRNQFS